MFSDFKIFPYRFTFHRATMKKPPPAGTAMVVVMLFGSYSNGAMILKSGLWSYKQHIAITFTACLSTEAGSYRKINKDKWKATGFGQWWFQYLSVWLHYLQKAGLGSSAIDKKKSSSSTRKDSIPKTPDSRIFPPCLKLCKTISFQD